MESTPQALRLIQQEGAGSAGDGGAAASAPSDANAVSGGTGLTRRKVATLTTSLTTMSNANAAPPFATTRSTSTPSSSTTSTILDFLTFVYRTIRFVFLTCIFCTFAALLVSYILPVPTTPHRALYPPTFASQPWLAALSPPSVDYPVAYELPSPLPSLRVNSDLITANTQLLGNGVLIGPEHYAFHPVDGSVYMSLATGRLVRATVEDSPAAAQQSGDAYDETTLLRTHTTDEEWPKRHRTLLRIEVLTYTGSVQGADEFAQRIGHRRPADACDASYQMEPACGRPLGMTFRSPDELIIADAYYGILSWSVPKRELRVLANTFVPAAYANATEDVQRAHTQPIVFANSVVLSADKQTLYFTDSTTRFRRRDVVYDVLESGCTGRLFEYGFDTGRVTEMVDDLCFPNGILLVEEHNTLVFAETTRARIMSYKLQPSSSSSSLPLQRPTVVLDNMPCLPDNLVWDATKSFYWVGCAAKRLAPFSSVDTLGRWPRLRSFFSWIVPRDMLFSIVPRFGLILRVKIETPTSGALEQEQQQHTIWEAWQDPSARLSYICAAEPHDGWLWLGSFRPDVQFAARLPWRPPADECSACA